MPPLFGKWISEKHCSLSIAFVLLLALSCNPTNMTVPLKNSKTEAKEEMIRTIIFLPIRSNINTGVSLLSFSIYRY